MHKKSSFPERKGARKALNNAYKELCAHCLCCAFHPSVIKYRTWQILQTTGSYRSHIKELKMDSGSGIFLILAGGLLVIIAAVVVISAVTSVISGVIAAEEDDE